MSNNNRTAAQKAAERAMSDDDKKPEEATEAKQNANQSQQSAPVDVVAETERLALIEENQRLAAELAELKEKTRNSNREANVYEPGAEVPEDHGLFDVELSAPAKDGRPAHILFAGRLVALDEPDALRQAIAALIDKQGWHTPPHWLVRKVTATKETLEQRDARLRFRQWRKANAARQDRGEDLRPLPANLSQFRDKLTDLEELATSEREPVAAAK